MSIIASILKRIAEFTAAAIRKETVGGFILKTLVGFALILIVTTFFNKAAKIVSEIVSPPKKYNLMEAGLGYKKGERIEHNGTEKLKRGYTVTTIRDIGIRQQQIRSHPIEWIELHHTTGAGLCRVRALVENVYSYDYTDILERFASEYANPSAVSDTSGTAAWNSESLEGRDLFYMSLQRNKDSNELNILYVFDNLCECIGETEMNEQTDYKDRPRPVWCAFDADHITVPSRHDGDGGWTAKEHDLMDVLPYP